MNLKFISISLNKKMVSSFLTLFLTFLFVNFSYAQYSGTGTFTRIASSTQLTDGYYVITNLAGSKAMSNQTALNGTLSYFVPVNSGDTASTISNPSSTIVWRIETNGSGRTIYNETSARYVNYTNNSWSVTGVPNVTTNFQRWSFTYSSSSVQVVNLGNNNSRLTYFTNGSYEDFSYYTGTGTENLQLYKMDPLATAATNIGSSFFSANWNSVLGSSSYSLDVSTTPFENSDIVGWVFPNTGASINPDIATSNNLSKQLITNSNNIIFATVGSEMVAASNGWRSGSNSKYWQIEVNTTGFYNLLVNAVQFSEMNGPSEFKVEFSIGNSGTWTLLGNVNVGNNLTTGVTNFVLPPECDNKAKVYIRWTMRSNTGLGGNIQNASYSAIDNIFVRSVNSPNYVFGYENLNVGNVTSFNVTGLSPFTTYYYRVRAVYGTSTSPNSNVIETKTYKDISTADFRSRANGNYNVANTWEFDSGIPEVGWVQATQPPGADNNVLIQAPHTVTMTANALFNSGKTLTVNGTLATATHSITGAGSITVPSGGVVASGNLSATDAFAGSLAVTGAINFQTGSTFELNGTAKQYLGARTFSNLKISNTSGVKALGNLTVDGELSLAANPNDTDGSLDMVINYGSYATNKYGDNTNGDFRNSTLPFNNLNSYVLVMGPNSTTTGPGDVTGKIRRTTIADNTPYTFGNANTQLRFTSVSGSALPSRVTVVATRGDHGTHIDNTGGVLINGYTANRNTLKRMYQVLQQGGATATRFTLRMAYQDSELNGNSIEDKLVTWDHHIPYGGITPHEHGKTNFDPTNNWVELSNHSVAYLATEGALDFTKYWMLSTKETVSDYVWLGAVGTLINGTNWNILSNWSGGKIPSSISDVLIPSASTTNNDPIINTSSGYGVGDYTTFTAGEVRMRTLEIASGGILNVESGSASKITLYGGPNANGGGINYGSWDNKGTFNPGNSKVIFDYDATASESTISGTTQFYDVEIATGKKATVQSDTQISISNTLVNNGTFNAALLPNTITYNGTTAQTVLPTTYYNLTIANGVSATLGGNATTLNTLTLSDKFLTTGSYKMTMGTWGVVSRTTGFVKGTLEKPLTAAPSLFEVGDTFYAPVTVSSTGLTGEVLMAAKPTTGNALGSVLNETAKSNVYWNLSKSGTGSITDYTASFDIANATNTGTLSRYRIAQNSASSWNILPNPTITGTLYTTPTRTTFGDFELGEVKKTTWTGTQWTPISPDIYTDAEIAGPYNTSVNGGNFSANSLTINDGQTLDITSGNAITVANEIVNNSVATGVNVQSNANLVQINEAINTGAITVRRSSAPMLRLDYTFWSSPVVGQNLFSFSPLTLSNRFYTFETASNSYINPGFNSSTTFTPGVAYVIRTPNNHSSTTPTPYNGVFTGVPNNGKYTFELSNTNDSRSLGYNGVGNPYPSSINASKFIDDNPSITGALYLFAHTGTGNASGQFATYTKSGGVAAGNTSSGAGNLNAPNGIIPVGQGFLVKANSNTNATGTIVFNNEQRINTPNGQFYRSNTDASSSQVERHRFWLNLSAFNTSGVVTMENQMLVAYITGATNQEDRGYDGKVYSSFSTHLASKIGDESFVIQGRALPFNPNDVVPLIFKANTAGTYEISLANTDGLFANAEQSIYIKDVLLGRYHNLKITPYRFTSEIGTFDSRFEIVYPNITLGENLFDENDSYVYASNNILFINSFSDAIKKVRVYDITGRLLFDEDRLDTLSFSTSKLPVRKEVILVQFETQSGAVITRKIIF